MKLKTISAIAITIMMILPMNMNAQGYTQLWKQVTAAQQKDLPKKQIEVLRRIEEKALQERSYGNLLKAQLLMVQAQGAISPDSLKPGLQRLEQKAGEAADPVLAAVYETVLGRIYKENIPNVEHSDDIAKTWFAKAMTKSDQLVKARDGAMEPLVVTGTDSRIFMHDLLHIVGFEAGAYKQLYDIYKARGNRSAACITAFLNARENRTDFTNEVRKSKYVQTLDSLISEYGDLIEAGELAIARYAVMEDAEDATDEERFNYVNYALSRWGAWPRMNILRNAQNRLTLPSFHVMVGPMFQIPNTPRKIDVLGVTNLSQLTMTIQRLNVNGDTRLNPADSEDYAKLKRLVDLSFQPFVQTRRYIGLPDYSTTRDTLELPGLTSGVYLLEFTTGNNSIKPERSLLFVSNVMAIHQTLADHKIRIAAVNATTGQPIPNCHIRLISNGRYGKEATTEETVTTGKFGEVEYRYGDRRPDQVYAYTDDDTSSPQTYFGGYFSYYDNEQSFNTAQLFTDRSIYRPGQTVHVAAVAYRNINHQDLTAQPHVQLTLTLRDANGKVVSEKEVTTDDYGSASADFVLPATGLTGRFLITSNYGQHSSAAIQVEEYKRPTFEVAFDKVTEKYTPGETVTATGTAKSYSGVPIQNAKVAYTITRRPALWWWRASARYNDKVLKTDTVTTDADGRFAIPVPMEMPDNYDDHAPRYFSFDINAVVTDAAGESHEGTLTLPLSDKATILTCDLPEKALRDSLTHIKFNYLNNAGQPISAEVRYTIDNGKEMTAPANETIKLSTFSHTGRHTLRAVCQGDTLEQSVVIFSMADKRPVIETHDWFYASATEFPRDGKPVYVQIGASDKDQHIFYTFIAGNTIVEQGVIKQSNALTTRQFHYDESYGNGLLLTYAWVKDGKLYRHATQIRKPLPEKHLDMQWKTFRNRLTPGQKEEWSLTVTHHDGKPAQAQLLAAMYDKSLDQILRHNWAFQPNRYLSMPSTSWNGPGFHDIGLYGEQPMKLLSAKELDFSRFDHDLLPYPYYEIQTYGLAAAGRPKMMKMSRMANVAAESLEMMDAAAPMALKTITGGIAVQEDALEEVVVTGMPKKHDAEQGGKTLRENLNETAFFFPAIHTDGNGQVTLAFTLPESVTTWRVMGFAHDTAMNYGHIDGEAVASKTVMVQPNMPRFLRAGDAAVIATRLSNTTEAEVTGTARLQLIDPATEKVVMERTAPFTLKPNSTEAVAFDALTLTKEDILICRITAEGKGYSDGEQHYLPVLSDKQRVTNTLPFTQDEPGTKSIDLTTLFPVSDAANKLTVEYTNNPAWLMIQTLPTVSNPYDHNAISLATAFYANSIANDILHQSPAIKNTISLWQQEQGQETSLMSSLQKNEDVKTLLLNETPWVFQADREADQKAQLINFFDENTIDYRLNDQFDKLRKLQNPDGSFSWWPGMEGSLYMTTSVTETLVRLNALIGEQPQTASLIDEALTFLTHKTHTEVTELKKLEKEGVKGLRPSEMAVNYLYIRALRNDVLKGSAKDDEAYLVSLLEKKATELSIYGKARTALILAHNHRDTRAAEHLQSLREYMVYKEGMGRYFDTPKALYSWRDYRIPSQVAAIEALKALAPDDKGTIRDMQRWLLQEKRTQAWDTPVNTVDAVYAFLEGQPDVLRIAEESEQTRLTVNGKALSLPKATAGLGYVKTAVTGSTMKTFTAEKATEGTSWGALYAQFYQPVTEIADAAEGLTVKRELITSHAMPLAVGDRIRVRITIAAERDYDFVQVADQRAACLEPVNQLSGYHYGYYIAPRDNATYYYFDCLRKGTHVIEAEYFVDRSGTYQSGVCTAQCAYSPEFAARTAAQTLTVVATK